MKIRCFYIGENPDIIRKLRANTGKISLSSEMHLVAAFNYLKLNPELDVVIFEAPEETDVANQYIDFYTQHIKKDVVFFVIANDREQQHALFRKDVDDVFLQSFSINSLLDRISFVMLNKKKLSAPIKENLPVFKLPLWKRVVDIAFSLTAIIMLSPILLLIALAIRLESKGKVFYASKRVGSGYRVFDFYKFRSMYTNADQLVEKLMKKNQYTGNSENGELKQPENQEYINDSALFGEGEVLLEVDFLQEKKAKQEKAFFKIANDPRITKIGRIIRNTSLDELPQLFNILKGDMSVVGNRPLPIYEAEVLTSDRWAKRFLAPAGLTGLWQVTKRGGANQMSADERKQLDIDYATNYTFFGDLAIMVKTIPALLQHENV